MVGIALTPQEVANRLQMARSTIYRLIQRREIPAVRVGGQYRIPVGALERLLTVPEETGKPDRQPAA